MQVGRFTRQVGLLRARAIQGELRGVDWSAYMLLFHLVAEGPMRSRALAEAVCADPSSVSRQSGTLVEHGLVERRPDPDDGRAVQLVATERGHELAVRMRGQRDALFDAVLVDWEPADVWALAGLLDRFTTDLERARPGLLRPTSHQNSTHHNATHQNVSHRETS